MYKNYTIKPGMPKRLYLKIVLIMRLTTVLLIASLMQVSAAGFGQKISLNESHASLQTIFDKIRIQSGVDFLTSKEVLRGTKPVSINVTRMELGSVLERIFDGQPLEFEIQNKMVVVRKKVPSLLDKTLLVIQNTNDILLKLFQDLRGRVVDENGEPLAGATIKVKNSNKTTKTNAEGEFRLQGVQENAILQISFIGYIAQEVKAAANLSTIKMVLDNSKLEEVMINAGYYSVKESERTGSISRITAKDIETQPVNNVIAVMQGRMAGVNITQTTGTPGGGFDIKIRGQNSIRTEGNAPLYIIDGVPYASDVIGAYQTTFGFPTLASPLNSINTDNIESIEILKDADATAIYGSRGANGVILITTKKGVAGKTKVDFNASSGAGKVTRFLKLMNTEEYLAMRKQAFTNDGLTTYEEWDYDINGAWDQTRNTDWQKELLGGSAETHTVQGTISGGTVNSQFLVSGSYRSESTVLPGDFQYRKGGAQANFNHQSSDQKFKVALSLTYSMQNNDQPSFDFSYDARSLPPNAPALYNADGSLNWENNTWTNPLANLNQKFESKTNDWRTNATLSYELMPGLILNSSLGLTDLGTVESTVRPSTVTNPAFNPSSSNSIITLNQTDRTSWIIEPQINWTRQWAGGKVDALIGSTFQDQNTSKLYQRGIGFSSNSLIYTLSAARTVTVLFNDLTRYRYQAFFGRLNYNYDQRYIVNLTARRDGSSRFGPGKQFANFGAVGAAWLFSNEQFLKEHNWISFGKLRASYGITGNDQIGDYQFFDTYTTSGVAYNNKIGLQPTRLYNPDFAWETNKKLEAAVELGLQNRINFTGAWYKNRSSNQLVGIPFPGTSGFSLLNANLDATVQNAGLEFTLNTEIVKTRTLSWSTNFNLSSSRNKLIRFPGLAGSSYYQKYRIGQPLNILLLYQYKEVNPQTGVYEFVDVNNDGQITFPEDKQSIADLTPKYFGGLQNQFTWKKWNLDFLFQFVKQKNASFPTYFTGLMTNSPKRELNSWQKNGDTRPYQIFTTGLNGAAVTAGSLFVDSDGTIVDASYLRLKNVSLSYDISLNQKGTKCKIMMLGQNLWTVTKYEDGDPEFMSYGFLPPLKMITAGVQLTF